MTDDRGTCHHCRKRMRTAPVPLHKVCFIRYNRRG